MSSAVELINSRRLIEGKTSKLMAISPMKHRWARDVWKVMLANTWFPAEIDLSRDIADYNNPKVMSPAEKRMYDLALAFLSNLDGIQFNNLGTTISPMITSPEVQMCVSRQIFEEANHVDSYSQMIEAISLDPMEVYMTFERDSFLSAKNDHITESAFVLGQEPTAANFALALVANIALEGIYFYSGFLAFYTLAKNQKMLGSTDMIRLIQRDEVTHLHLFVQMFKTLQAERPELFDAAFWNAARSIFAQAVSLETTWGKYIIKDGVLGLTDPIIDAYIKWLANDRWAMITKGELFPGVKNPVAWVDSFSDPNKQEQNFFEGKVTNYSTGALEW